MQFGMPNGINALVTTASLAMAWSRGGQMTAYLNSYCLVKFCQLGLSMD